MTVLLLTSLALAVGVLIAAYNRRVARRPLVRRLRIQMEQRTSQWRIRRLTQETLRQLFDEAGRS